MNDLHCFQGVFRIAFTGRWPVAFALSESRAGLVYVYMIMSCSTKEGERLQQIEGECGHRMSSQGNCSHHLLVSNKRIHCGREMLGGALVSSAVKAGRPG